MKLLLVTRAFRFLFPAPQVGWRLPWRLPSLRHMEYGKGASLAFFFKF